ncbi:MAG: hypothetical protein ACP5XB_07815 [Isosphaeraceae bacterium]
MQRREFLALATAGAAMPRVAARAEPRSASKRVPVIDITDLYHPPQDVGDNLDLIAAFALPEVDLKAVILDVTTRFRESVSGPPGDPYRDTTGPREPGFIPVWQLNALFGRNVPCAVGPYTAMCSPDDPMRDAPAFQQQGVELMLKVLRESPEPVHIVSFGSARPLALAWNREPELLRKRVARAHLCIGAAPAGYLEWNVMLDVAAFVRLLRSDLPIALYPCATDKGPFDLGRNNTYWKLPSLSWLRDLSPGLRRYAVFALNRTVRMDWLRALEHDPPAAVLDEACNRPHNVWETAVWAEVCGRSLVRRGDGTHRLVPTADIAPKDTLVSGGLKPCQLTAGDDGQFTFNTCVQSSIMCIYERDDPLGQQAALRDALPVLYRSFSIGGLASGHASHSPG